MYPHPGKEIKGNAKLLTTIWTIPSVLLGIGILIAMANMSDMLGAVGIIFGIMVGGIVTIVGIISARILGSLLYGFGVIVEKMENIDSIRAGVGTAVNTQGFQCTCGHINDKDAVFCTNCGKHR